MRQELPGKTSVEVAYVGVKGTHLSNGLISINQLDPRYLSLGSVLTQSVTSAAEGKRRLAGPSDTEALSDKVQRVVVLAMPIVRILARGARLTRLPWAMIASSSVSIGLTVRTGVRELQVLASLVAYRLEQATGAPSDPGLVKKVAIDLYLDPKRAPDLADSRLRLVRLTRKWLFLGAFGRKTSTRAERALDAADKLDANELAARWGQGR